MIKRKKISLSSNVVDKPENDNSDITLSVKKELSEQFNVKELILKIKHINWGLNGPGDWNNTEWKIYSDLTVDIIISYNYINYEENNTKYNCKLTRADYDKLFEKIGLAKKNDVKVDADDGSVWEIIQYQNDQEIWRRDAGYIYGIKSLEDMSVILNNLVKD